MASNPAFDSDVELKTKKEAPISKTNPPNIEPLPILGKDGLFQFANATEKMYMIIGVICAIIHGAGYPVIFIFYGDMTNDFIQFSQCEYYTSILFNETAAAPPPAGSPSCYNEMLSKFNLTEPELCNFDIKCQNCDDYQIEASDYLYTCFENNNMGDMFPVPSPYNLTSPPMEINVEKAIGRYAVIFLIIAVVCLTAATLQIVMFTWSSAAQAKRIRAMFYEAVVKQEIGWFDLNTVGEINSKIAEDITRIADGMGDKFSVLIQKFACFVIGFIVAYTIGWELALVITSIIPLIIGGGFVMGKFVGNMTSKELKAYAKAGSISQEVIDGIRVVTAFEGQSRETMRYDKNLSAAEKQGVRKGLVTGFFMGYIWLVVFMCFAISFYVGADVFYYPAGQLITVFFCILMGSMYLGQAAPNLEAVSIAKTAARPVFDIIKRQSKIDATSDKGRILKDCKGDIQFHNVCFNYPLRPDIQILKNVNLKCNASEISAICGPSGMGKSTILHMILRFYDPDQGKITLDGVDLTEINVKWLRSLICVVEQEPAMLAGSVMRNIKFGRRDASDAEAIEAARQANCYDFIMQLPQGFDTELTSGGGGLSGGQKQRVAVARALCRGAKILLLDQATSALDTHSEKMVISEINKRKNGRTTLIVAHRLSTIRAADKINGIEHGSIVENGTHDELMKKEGVYFKLVILQGGDSKKSDEKVKSRKNSVHSKKEEIDAETGFSRSASLRFRKSLKDRTRSQLSQTAAHATKKLTPDEPYDPLKDENSQQAEMTRGQITKRILGYNSKETCIMVMGGLSAIVNGAIMPFFSMIFSYLLQVLGRPAGEERDMGIIYGSVAFGVIGLISFVTQFLQNSCFAKSGEKLTRRLRRISFKSILGQDMTWFDSPKNSPSVLVGSLASDCVQVQGAAGQSLGAMFQAIAAIITGLSIAFIYGWELALVVLCFFPFIIIAGIVQGRIWSGSASRDRVALKEASMIVNESLTNIRVVAATGNEQSFNGRYVEEIEKPYQMALGGAWFSAVMYAISQTTIFFAYGASFGYGGYLVQSNILEYYFVFRVFAAVIFGGQAVGRAMAFAPEFAKAQLSAVQVFRIIDRVASYADPYSNKGKELKYETSKGEIILKDIDFRYPSRPDTQVLHKLNLKIPAGKTVAFVGQSGCGKSTSMQLLQRFYDPEAGSVIVDGVKTVEANTHALRRMIGIVAQDPILFDVSVKQNIAYGIPEGAPCSDVDVIKAAKAANAHEFIMSLPEKYDTLVGPGGNSLARGQKQRICIARAVIRNPRILLLDEATSALDTEAEQIVTVALEEAAKSRTCLLIAHRLSTVRNADIIAVMDSGVVKEAGSHDELMAKQGMYYKLVMANADLS